MSTVRVPWSAEELRREFDQAFAKPIEPSDETNVAFLAVRAGDQLLALRVSDARGVIRCPRITRLPGDAPALLGVAAIRGALVAMYSLASFVTGSMMTTGGGWAVLCGDRSIGLVFDELQRYVHIPQHQVHRPSELDRRDLSVTVVEIGNTSRAVVDIPALLTLIHDRTARPDFDKER